MRLEIEIPDDWRQRLNALQIPAEHCGPTIEERMVFFIGNQLDGWEAMERDRKSIALHRQFGVTHPMDDDDMPF